MYVFYLKYTQLLRMRYSMKNFCVSRVIATCFSLFACFIIEIIQRRSFVDFSTDDAPLKAENVWLSHFLRMFANNAQIIRTWSVNYQVKRTRNNGKTANIRTCMYHDCSFSFSFKNFVKTLYKKYLYTYVKLHLQ